MASWFLTSRLCEVRLELTFVGVQGICFVHVTWQFMHWVPQAAAAVLGGGLLRQAGPHTGLHTSGPEFHTLLPSPQLSQEAQGSFLTPLHSPSCPGPKTLSSWTSQLCLPHIPPRALECTASDWHMGTSRLSLSVVGDDHPADVLVCRCAYQLHQLARQLASFCGRSQFVWLEIPCSFILCNFLTKLKCTE